MIHKMIPLLACCPLCLEDIVLSLDLMRFIEEAREDAGSNEESPEDKSIREAIGRGKKVNHIHLTDVPIPIAIDVEGNGIAVLGWCRKCKAPAYASISIEEIEDFIEEERNKNGES